MPCRGAKKILVPYLLFQQPEITERNSVLARCQFLGLGFSLYRPLTSMEFKLWSTVPIFFFKVSDYQTSRHSYGQN